MSIATTELINRLNAADDWRERRQAALRLGRLSGEGAYLALSTALGDHDPDVRHAAILSLGRFADPRALELLCRPVVLEDPSVEIRWAAVTALGQLGDLSIARVLAEVLEDPEWVVRNQAVLVMADLIRRMPESVDGEQVKVLIRLLAIHDAEVHELVVDALARRSTRGLDEMVEAMRLKSRAVRAGVAEALGLSRDPRAVAPLIEATGDTVAVVRREAARGLGRLGDPRAVEALVVLLGDSDAATARAAVQALVAIGEPAVVPLCSALEHGLPKLHRRNLIRALGGIGDRRAVLALLNSLSSTYYVVRQATIIALSAFGDRVVDDLIPMVEVSEVPLDALVREVREQPNKRLRLRAIRSLGELKNAAAIRPLRELLQGRDREILATAQLTLSKIGLAAWARYGAVIALGNIGNRRALPALTRALVDHSEYVRTEAARALAKLADPSTAAALITSMERDEDAVVRREAAAALRVVSDRGRVVTAAFRKALTDESWEVRTEAARALGRIDDEASVGPLIAALGDPSYTVMTSAVHALANLGPLALPRLLKAAAGADDVSLAPVLRALGELLGEEKRSEVEGLSDLPPAQRGQKLKALATHSVDRPGP